jgi:hypothetical protein
MTLTRHLPCTVTWKKLGVLEGHHAHSWGHKFTTPPKGTSLRENTSFEPSTNINRSAVRSEARSKKAEKKTLFETDIAYNNLPCTTVQACDILYLY